MTRCREYLEAHPPDTPNHTRETIIIQCDRTQHAKGVHRYKEEITWFTPAETTRTSDGPPTTNKGKPSG